MTKLKQTQEALRAVSDKKEQLIEKYTDYIDNCQWYKDNVKPKGFFLDNCNIKIEIYTEFNNDLKFL